MTGIVRTMRFMDKTAFEGVGKMGLILVMSCFCSFSERGLLAGMRLTSITHWYEAGSNPSMKSN